MSHLMHCKHHKTKKKLVAWRYTWRNKWKQGFTPRECCVDCGCEVKK